MMAICGRILLAQFVEQYFNNSCYFSFKQAVYHNLKPASLQQQLQSIHLDQDKAEAFASAWAAAGQDTIEKFRQRVLTPQKVIYLFIYFNLRE